MSSIFLSTLAFSFFNLIFSQNNLLQSHLTAFYHCFFRLDLNASMVRKFKKISLVDGCNSLKTGKTLQVLNKSRVFELLDMLVKDIKFLELNITSISLSEINYLMLCEGFVFFSRVLKCFSIFCTSVSNPKQSYLLPI